MQRYYLKHKDDVCAALDIDPNTWHIENAKVLEPEIAPFAGNATDESIKQWWKLRAVPSTRKTMEKVIREAGCVSNEEYLAKNLALSVTDTYWICPIGMELRWENVNSMVLSAYDGGKMPYHNVTSYDPNAALSGQMDKYWDLRETPPELVKNAYLYYGQQGVNEVFATFLHENQETSVPYVKYTAKRNIDKGCLETRCRSFAADGLEFVSAYEIMYLVKKRNERSNYDTYIDECVKRGISEQEMRDFMDYQTLTDFVITNADEHLNNFGILRNPDTMRFVKPAPIYDSGNSMFYEMSPNARPLEKYEILQRKITSFHDKEEKMLTHVKNRNIVNIDRLPTEEQVKEIYIQYGIHYNKAETISKNYMKKVEMLSDFQNGMRISAFREKKNAFGSSRSKETLTAIQAKTIFGDAPKSGYKTKGQALTDFGDGNSKTGGSIQKQDFKKSI